MLFNLREEKYHIFNNSNVNLAHEFENYIGYKVNILIDKEVSLVSSFILDSSNFYSGSEKYPEESINLQLEKGDYILFLKESNNDNNIIKSSKGAVNFENNFYTFKISRIKKFSIWLTNIDDYPFFSFDLYKIVSTYDYQDNNLVSSLLISYSVNSNLNLDTKFLYKFEYYSFSNEFENEEVKPKYPTGTYQLSINEIIKTNNKNIDQTIAEDIINYDLNNENKLNSLDNILIPAELNPINYYSMIGHYEIIVILDYNSDNIMVYQNSFLEAFLSLYIPESTYEIIENNDTYSLLKVNIYEFIAESYNNVEQIKNGLKNLASFLNKDFHQDEYGLYFWVNTFSIVSHTQIEKIKNFIKDQFYYLHLSIRGFFIDDLTVKYENEDDTLNTFTFESCSYQIHHTTDKINFNFNNISWVELPSPNQNSITNWYNESPNIENILKLSLSGSAIIRISKQKFKSLLNIDLSRLEENTNYSLTKEQFELLKLNKPIIYPFERLQNWLIIKNI